MRGFRGAEPADAAALVDLVHRLAALGDDLPAVAELDLNLGRSASRTARSQSTPASGFAARKSSGARRAGSARSSPQAE